MTIIELREKRNKAWEAAKAFVETKRDKDGLLSAEDAASYAEMEQKIKDYGAEIERMEQMAAMDAQLSKPTSGELERSLGLSPVMVDKNGNHDIKVGFSEPRTDGGSNAKIANILEYGTSSQSAKPFLKPAKSAVKKQCVEAMKSAFEKEVEGL